MIHIAALLLAAATSQTSDSLFQDGFNGGYAYSCPESIATPTGTRTLRHTSDIIYLPNAGHVRHGVTVTKWDNIWGHITELDGITTWPGVAGASPTIESLGKHQFIGAKFHTPPDMLPNLRGWYKHVMYGGGPPIDFAISRLCGDFDTAAGCSATNAPANDNTMVSWRANGTTTAYQCGLAPDTDYYVNIRISNPNVTGPDCSGEYCWSTIQNYLGF